MPEQEMTALRGEPLPVEFRHAGTWYSAVLLGWRHREDGSCDLRLRFVADGLRRRAWLPIADVQLPAAAGTTEPRDRLRPDRDWSRPLRPVPPWRRPDGDQSPVQDAPSPPEHTVSPWGDPPGAPPGGGRTASS